MKCGQRTPELKLRRLPFCGVAAAILLASLLCSCGGGVSGLVIVLDPSVNQAVDQGQSVSFTAFVSNDTSNSGVTWSISGSHCKGSACGTLVDVTTGAVTYQAPSATNTQLLTVTLTATANAETSVTTTLNIVVSPAPVISTTTLPGVLNGATYSEQILANGGVAPLIFTVSSGSLPPGLNLNTNGFVTGRTTSDGGTYNFTVKVTDQGTPPLTVSRAFTLVVTPAPTLFIKSTSLMNAAQGSPYSTVLAANGGVPPLTWTIISGSLPPGLTLTTSTGQISGTPTTQSPTPYSFEVQVTDSSLLPPNNQPQTASQSLSITVGRPNTLAIATTSLPEAESANLYSQKIVATGGIAPFNWTLTKGILPTGMSLDASTGVISGVATAVSSNTFTIQVTDSENAMASATFTISIVAATDNNNNALLEGDYVFTFSGYDPNGPVVLGGTLEADGSGNIEGTIDSNNHNPASETTQNNGPGPTQGNALTGTYAMKPDGQGTLTLTVNSIVYEYVVALDGNGDAQFIEADSTSTSTRGTGILRKQPPPNFIASNFNGNYAFQLAGTDSAGKRATFAGVFQADGVGSFSDGNVDSNDAGTLGTNITGVSGTFLVAQDGRGNATFSIPGRGSLNFVFYMITPSDVLFMGFDPLDSSHPMMTGEAILQTQSSFDATSMSGSSIATETGQSSALLAQVSGNGAGAASAAINTNDSGSIGSTTASGSYVVSSNGRIAMSGLGTQLRVLYLISPNYGFLIGEDSAASSGLAEAQSAGPFNAASFASYFTFGPPFAGSPAAGSVTTNDFVGSIVSDGVSTISGTIGETTGSDVLNLTLSTKGSYTVNSNGKGFISFGSPTQLPSQFVFYLVSPTAVRAISAVPSDTQPMVFFLNH